MLISARYEAEQKLHESAHHVIYRGRRQADGAPVILKLLNQAYPTAEQLQRFRWEHEVLERLPLPGVVRSYGLEESAGSAVIVLEDFGGVPLVEAAGGAPLPLPELLSVAARLTATLGEIHRRGVLHRDLNPTNILWNRATDTLKIIDFGLAAVLPRESPALPRPAHLEGTVAYVAPEQTGRLSRGVDQRTDLYALGVTLFELLTGRRPFLATDPSELVHQHLARTPPAPDSLVPGLPAPVSQLVLRLLAKRPEDRYQGTCGLAADLDRCRTSLARTGSVPDFPLAEQDVADTFRLPGGLHGREVELQGLEAALHRAHGGGRELLLVSGPGGIGKSALVEALRHRRGVPDCTFLAGKHDQVRRGVPYAGLGEAFQGLVNQILGEPAEAVAAWRQRMHQALGNGAPLIVEIIPAVGLILGPQPGIAELSLDEARNRFSYVLTRFVALFATAERPLVLFLDDLQWADGPALKVIELLVSDPAIRHVLVIGALRDGEVDATHPAAMMPGRVRQAGGAVTEVSLGPLDAPAIEELLAGGLRCDPAIVPALAERCRIKTAGNPFFLGQFLRALYEVGALDVDPAHGWWRCDLAAVDRAEATDNVLALLTARLRRLAPETLGVIRLAACLGGRFTARALARAGEMPETEAGAAMAVAVAEGLFVAEEAVGDAVSGDGDASELAHRFVHERVQQAAYALIPEAERPALRWHIGQALLSHAGDAELEAGLFEVVSHLNEGRTHARTDAERERLCRLNLRAGQKARAAAAFSSARRFLGVAHDLLPPDVWTRDHDLAVTLHAEAAGAAYLVGDFDRMEGYLAAAEPHLASALETARFGEIRISALSQGTPLAAVKAGIPILRQLGYSVPERPSKARLIFSLLRTRLAYRTRDIERLVDLPPLEDPRLLTALRILQSTTAASYMQSTWEFKVVNVLDRVNAVLRNGLHPDAAFDFASYGTILCALGDVDRGYRFGELALRLLDRPGASACRAKALMTFNRFIGHWKRHVGETLDGFLDAYRSGCESGDIEYAGYAILAYYTHSFYLGKELTPLEADVGAFLAANAGSRQATIHRPLRLYRQAMRNLVGPVEDPCRLVGEGCDEDALLADFRSSDYSMGICILHLLKLKLGYLFRQHRQAAQHAQTAVRYAEFVKGQIYQPILEFYDSLAGLAVYRESDAADRRSTRARVRRNQRHLERWARQAPMNYRHKHALVAAEEARVTDRPDRARELYDRAISDARLHGYRNEEALAQELAGNFYLELGHEHLAFHYLRDAKAAYRQWGARAKVQELERHFPQVLALERARPSGTVTRTASTRSTSEGSFTELDLSTVFKAAQVLSSQLELDRLLPALMELLIENAGARRGLLLLEQDGRWIIAAEGSVDEEGVRLPEATAADPTLLPMSVLLYVTRTLEPVVLADATTEGPYRQDPYVQTHRPRSLLCAPLLKAGTLAGVVYLENRLTAEGFTPDRLALVSLLSSQAAISLEIARLYTTLKASEQKYRLLFTASKDAIFIAAADGRILDMNPAGLRLFGYAEAEVRRLTVRDFYFDQDLASQMGSDIISSGGVAGVEMRLRRKDGTAVECLASATVRLGETGEVLGFQGILQDITERKRREEIERRLEAYRLSPAGRAEAFAAELGEHPADLLGALHGLAGSVGQDPARGALLAALPQILSNAGLRDAATLAVAFGHVIGSLAAPELLPLGLRQVADLLRVVPAGSDRSVPGAARLYGLAQEAVSVTAVAGITALAPRLPPRGEARPDLPPTLHPLAEALSGLRPVAETLSAYERVDSLADRLAYLASAVERLGVLERRARIELGTADLAVVQRIAQTWLAVVTGVMADLQTSARLSCRLVTRQVLQGETLGLVLGLVNEGRAAAVNLQVQAVAGPGYTVLGEGETLAQLAPGDEAQVQVPVRPTPGAGLERIRVRFALRFADPRGPDQVEHFADVVSLIEAEETFQFVPNPYAVGTPLQPGSPLFIGREDLMASIQEHLAASHRNHLVIIGQRRMGKTSLLKQLGRRLGDEHVPVYLDGQTLGIDPGRAGFFTAFATDVAYGLEDRGFALEPPDPARFAESPALVFEREFLPEVRRVIGDRHLLVLLDEFEELEAAVRRGALDPAVFGWLRHLIQHTDRLSLIFCGTHRLEELAADYWSVLFNICLYQHVGFLTRAQSERLIQEPVAPFAVRYDDLALEKMWQVTSGHPYFLQLLCHSLVNRHNRTHRSYLTVADVNAALEEIISTGEAHFVYLWTESTPAERLLLAALSRTLPLGAHATPVQILDHLSERGLGLDRPTAHQALHRLCLREILQRRVEMLDAGGDAYGWRLGLVGLWVAKSKSLERIGEERKP